LRLIGSYWGLLGLIGSCSTLVTVNFSPVNVKSILTVSYEF